MLEGTELNFAYNSLSNTYADPTDMYQELAVPQEMPAKKQASKSSSQSQQASASSAMQQPQSPQIVPQSAPMYDAGMFASNFNRQYDQEQRLMALLNEYKKQQNKVYNTKSTDDSYWDKLTSKKKELLKFLQSALIIILALSVHFLIVHYFNIYIETNDVSYQREMWLRILYPVAIAFIGWNLITFNK